MADSISGADVRRLEEQVPDDVEDAEDVQEYLDEQFDAFSPKARREFAERITSMRDLIDAAEDQLTVSGAGASGERTAMVQASDGTYLGTMDTIKTWIDAHDNLMGENVNTGTRKKITEVDGGD